MAVDQGTRILALADKLQPRFRRSFLETVKRIRDTVALDQVETLLLAGRIDEALLAVETAALRLGQTWGQAFVLSGEQTSQVIENALRVDVVFDQVNTRAVAEMQRNTLRLVREFTTGQRAATRQALIDGVRDGVNPREMVRRFQGSIGLTANQERAVNNFRRLLGANSREALTRELRDKRFDGTIRRAIANDRPLSAAQIERMTDRYRQRFLRFRAETIARTEALESAHAGSHEMFRQAVDNGTLARDDLIRTWDDSGDGRVRDFPKAQTSHRSMDGQQRRLEEPFISGAGNPIRYPGDSQAPAVDRVQCRCAVTTRFRKADQATTAAPAQAVAATA